MAGRKQESIEVNLDWFHWVREKVGRSIRSLGKERGGSTYYERNIRQALEPDKENPEVCHMTPRMIDALAKTMEVDPEYLSGKYLWTLQLPIMDECNLREYWRENHLHPKWHPYIHHEQEEIGVYKHLHDTLLMHGIDQEAYKNLTRRKRWRLKRDLDRMTTEILRHYLHQGELIEDIEYRQGMEWQTEDDVIDTLFPYLEELGLVKLEPWEPDDMPDPFAEKYKDIPLAE